jgi:hypothetical protein
MIATTTYRKPAPQQRWWTRPPRPHHDRATEVLAVLQHARAIVEAGWVQNRWTVTTAPAEASTSSESSGGGATPGGSVQACVVAAVALAVRARDSRADLALDTGPALAHLWDVVFDGHVAGRSAPYEVRISRMRELARWNDRPGRTRDDVVAALDRAAARVVALSVEPERV